MVQKFYRFSIFPYTFFLLYLMFFGFGRVQMNDNIVRITPVFSTINFAEKCILWSNFRSLAINFLGNIIMFVPFGFLGWIFPKFQNLKTLMITFLSFLIVGEALQYFTRLGVFDVDDILLNSLGVWIGFLIKKNVENRNVN